MLKCSNDDIIYDAGERRQVLSTNMSLGTKY